MKKTTAFFSFLLFFTVASYAQERAVTGVVKSNDDNPLTQTTITIKGTKKAVASDNKGRYKIEVSGKNSVLVFSHVGFITKEVPVAGKSVIDVILDADAATLGDVVVVGYGTQQKKDVTVSIEKVNMKDLNKAPVRSFDEALAGRVAGVQVTSSDGQPGSESRIIVSRF